MLFAVTRYLRDPTSNFSPYPVNAAPIYVEAKNEIAVNEKLPKAPDGSFYYIVKVKATKGKKLKEAFGLEE